MMKYNDVSIGIIGGGFSGLAMAHKFITSKSFNISKLTIIDKVERAGIGGASAASSGILHPFTPTGKLIWQGLEGYESACKLIKHVQSQNLHKRIILSENNAVIRPMFENSAKIDKSGWSNSLLKENELLKPIDIFEYQNLIGLDRVPKDLNGGIILKKSMLIDSSLYLEGMWNSIVQIGSQQNVDITWSKCVVVSEDSLKALSSNYDILILSCGASIHHLWPSSIDNNPLKYSKGINVLYPRLPGTNHTLAIARGEYIVPIQRDNNDLWLCGATKEPVAEFIEDIASYPSDNQICRLKSRIQGLDPSFENLDYLPTKGGIRVETKRTNIGRLPLLLRFPDTNNGKSNIWLITALGSRGLIHHALLADFLFQAIAANDETLIPQELQLEAK